MSSFRWLIFNKHYKIATPGLCGSVQYHPWRAAIIIYDAIYPVTERDRLSSCRRTTKTHFGQSFQLITWGVANFHPKATGTLSSLPSSSFIALLVDGTNNLQRVRMHPGICLYCWMLALVGVSINVKARLRDCQEGHHHQDIHSFIWVGRRQVCHWVVAMCRTAMGSECTAVSFALHLRTWKVGGIVFFPG